MKKKLLKKIAKWMTDYPNKKLARADKLIMKYGKHKLTLHNKGDRG